MPRAQPVPLRPAAEAAPAQRPRRTRPRLVAIRVLRRRRPPVPPQTAPAPHRRLRPSLQSHKASPSPWRSHPSRVPLNHQPGDRPVSYGLNSDRLLRAGWELSKLLGAARSTGCRDLWSYGQRTLYLVAHDGFLAGAELGSRARPRVFPMEPEMKFKILSVVAGLVGAGLAGSASAQS